MTADYDGEKPGAVGRAQQSEGEDVHVEQERRRFLKVVSVAAGTLLGATVAVPALWTLVGGVYRKSRTAYTKVTEVSELQTGSPQNPAFQSESVEAYVRERVTHRVWVIKHSPTSLTVFAPVCTHLGCHYDWDPESGHFVCPCHGSAFAITGEVLSGPAPRPLDTLPYKIENGDLYVEWERFEPGIPEKVRI